MCRLCVRSKVRAAQILPPRRPDSPLASLFDQHVRAHELGVVMCETGFHLARNPDTVRGPDVSFVRRMRIASEGIPEGFWSGAPDLAVEIRPPGDRPSEDAARIDDYLRRGVRLVWTVDPGARTVTVSRRLSPPVTLDADETLEGGDVVPGFRCPVREIFA